MASKGLVEVKVSLISLIYDDFIRVCNWSRDEKKPNLFQSSTQSTQCTTNSKSKI